MTLFRDLKYAVRGLRKKAIPTTVALVTLALGIGANSAIFSVVQAVLLAPLPYPDADRLARVWPNRPVSTELFEHFAERTAAFESLSLYSFGSFSLTGEGRPEEIAGLRVTGGHFETVGVEPAIGRGFLPDESIPGNDRVAVLSYGLWQSRFGGDPKVLGRSLVLDGSEHTIVGVLPESYLPLEEGTQVWVPLPIDRTAEEHWDMIVHALAGRLAPGATFEQATRDLQAAVSSYGELRPGYFSGRAEEAQVVPMKESRTGEVKTTFLVLFGAVGLVLLAACANLTSLLLAQITSRRRELALRGALGATRWNLLAQVMTESAVLALAGGALGLLVASWTLGALISEIPSSVPRAAAIGIDSGVLFFTLVLSLAAGLAVAVLPALRGSRSDLGASLTTGARAAGGRRHRLHHAFIAAEVALAVVLTIGAGLLVKSFQRVREVDPGFVASGVHTFQLKPPTAAYEGEEAVRRYFEQVAERVRAVPGVASAAVINRLPMAAGYIGLGFRLPEDEGPGQRQAGVRMMTPELPETLGIPIVRGRGLLASDRAASPSVGLVNETMARSLWGDADPIGRRLVFDTGELWFTVVGVIGDTCQNRLAEKTPPIAYRPLEQEAWEQRMTLVVRSAPGVAGLVPAVEEAVWSVDASVPITGVATLEQLLHRSLRHERFLVTLFALFAVLALVLGVVGIFGVTAYTVSQSTHSNGVRLALGATAAAVVRESMLRILAPVAAGLLLGCLLSGWLTRFLEGFLFEVQSTDPSVFASVVLLLLACAAYAAWLPARRAARVDPMAVLKSE